MAETKALVIVAPIREGVEIVAVFDDNHREEAEEMLTKHDEYQIEEFILNPWC